ncbi:MAG: hypothetical protein JXR76_24325 [Deltaproteobacteria bacterium]|nr:hypothetical protein [Deltaproteobacteria bacterium]
MNHFESIFTWVSVVVMVAGGALGCDYVSSDVDEEILSEVASHSDTATNHDNGTDDTSVSTESASNGDGNSTDGTTIEACDPLTPVDGILCDARDGKSYQVVTVGQQVWMAENLNYALFGSICYDNLASNCDRYGRLYSWNKALLVENAPENPYEVGVLPEGSPHIQGVCPDGWHLPSSSDMSALRQFISETYPTITEADVLKSTDDWGAFYNGQDKVGLNILPAGWYLSGDEPARIGEQALFWVDPSDFGMPPSPYGEDLEKPCYFLKNEAESLEFTKFYHTDMASIRCVKDTSVGQ